MPQRSNDFQRLIAVIQRHLDPDSNVTESAMLTDLQTGTMREVDTVIVGSVAGQPITVSVEARYRGRAPDVAWVEAMQAKHARLPTNKLVLVAHKPFSDEALRVARLHAISCLVFAEINADAPDRLFPDVQSLWGKAWQLTVEHVEVSVGTEGNLPAETGSAGPNMELLSQDRTVRCSVRDFATAFLKSPAVIEKVTNDAKPEHTFLDLEWDRPFIQGQPVCVQKIEPSILRSIERFRVIAKSVVTIDEFPLRHGLLDRLRVAYGTGEILGQPATGMGSIRLARSHGTIDNPVSRQSGHLRRHALVGIGFGG